jgi:hypothetical protein
LAEAYRLTCDDGGAPRGTRTLNRQIRRRLISVELVGSSRDLPCSHRVHRRSRRIEKEPVGLDCHADYYQADPGSVASVTRWRSDAEVAMLRLAAG